MGIDFHEFFNYGVPTGVLVMLLIGIWRMVRWAKTDIVQPVVKAHLGLIEKLDEHLPRQSEAMDKGLKKLDELSDAIIKHDAHCQALINNKEGVSDESPKTHPDS